jgi:hypothetical protein
VVQNAICRLRSELIGAYKVTQTSVEQHRSEAPLSVTCMIVTVSDTRTPETDKSGALLRELMEAARPPA